ncbi:hypothetical protein JCM19298_182 [Nonlabens ulvanivorans]|nr:hypothetical protein JCM19298_182 [Nonlabens ulvanivorans]
MSSTRTFFIFLGYTFENLKFTVEQPETSGIHVAAYLY